VAFYFISEKSNTFYPGHQNANKSNEVGFCALLHGVKNA